MDTQDFTLYNYARIKYGTPLMMTNDGFILLKTNNLHIQCIHV